MKTILAHVGYRFMTKGSPEEQQGKGQSSPSTVLGQWIQIQTATAG